MNWNEKVKQDLLEAVFMIDNDECDGVILLVAAPDHKINSIAAMMPEVQARMLERLKVVVASIEANVPIPNDVLGPHGEDLRS